MMVRNKRAKGSGPSRLWIWKLMELDPTPIARDSGHHARASIGDATTQDVCV